MTGRDPRVTVVVLTHNRADEVCRTVDHLLRLPERPLVIVVDNGSTDDTIPKLRARCPSADVVAVGANMGAAGRNVGIARARTRYVALSDDDTWWEAGSLRVAADALDANDGVAIVTARVLVGADGRIDRTSLTMAASLLRGAAASRVSPSSGSSPEQPSHDVTPSLRPEGSSRGSSSAGRSACSRSIW